MIQIITYTIEELLLFIKSEEYARMPVIPISPQRVLSIAHSPRTKPDDVVLACAYVGKELVGYLGLLPDTCAVKEHIYRMGWLSSMWVSTAQRGKGIAPQLINSLLKAWDNMVITTNQSPVAAGVFHKHPDFSIIPNTGMRYYMKSRLAHFIPRKKPSLKHFTPFLKVIDASINGLINFQQLIHQTDTAITIQTTQEITPELALLIQTHHLKAYSNRGVEELKWILNYPWVHQAIQPDSMAAKYEFTISTNDYRNEFVLCYNNQILVGAALVMLKNSELKIAYAWCEKSDELLLAKALQMYIRNHHIFEVTVFSPLHQYLLASGDAFYLHQNPITRNFYPTKKLHELLHADHLGFIDGDGDCCFA